MKKLQATPDFLFIKDGNLDCHNNLVALQNISIKKNNNNRHNLFRYDVLSRNKKITVRMNGLQGSVDRFTAGVFDFKNNRIMHYEDFDVSGEVVFRFAVGENIDGLAFCVYAGICGSTQGQELYMNHFDVFEENM